MSKIKSSSAGGGQVQDAPKASRRENGVTLGHSAPHHLHLFNGVVETGGGRSFQNIGERDRTMSNSRPSATSNSSTFEERRHSGAGEDSAGATAQCSYVYEGRKQPQKPAPQRTKLSQQERSFVQDTCEKYFECTRIFEELSIDSHRRAVEAAGWKVTDNNINAEFKKVVNQTFDENISWGNVIGFFGFALGFSLFIHNKGMKRAVISVAEWTKQVIEEDIGSFFLEHNGWSYISFHRKAQLKAKPKAISCRWLQFWKLLLLTSGDVETNPGPMTHEQITKVTNTQLDIGDHAAVLNAISSLSGRWRPLFTIVGLEDSQLSSIEKDNPRDVEQCLSDSIMQWLKCNYDIQKHEPPSWRSLVAAIKHSAGGQDHALAIKIAEEHKEIKNNDSRCRKTKRKASRRNQVMRFRHCHPYMRRSNPVVMYNMTINGTCVINQRH